MQSMTLELRSNSFEGDQADELWQALGTLPKLNFLSASLQSTYNYSVDEEEPLWPEPWIFGSISLLSHVT